jgi:phytol kinase
VIVAISSWLLLPLVVVLLIVTMLALSAARTAGQLSPEGARKLFHVAMGTMTLSFPWLFTGPTPVLLLAGLCCVWFESVRRLTWFARHCGPVLSAVARPGRGEIYFVLGTSLTFLLCGGNALAFVLAMAILTWADTAAALVGQRLGGRPGALRIGGKSLAGSSAFFVVALTISLLGLSMAGWPPAQASLMSILLASTTTVLEALARRGADNLLIPVGAALLLRGIVDPTQLPGGVATAFCITAFTITVISAVTAWRSWELKS